MSGAVSEFWLDPDLLLGSLCWEAASQAMKTAQVGTIEPLSSDYNETCAGSTASWAASCQVELNF